jgi:hypothetical protein
MSLARLVIATAAVLVLGGWWWVATAPPPSGRLTAVAPPTPTPVPTTGAADHPHPAEIFAFDISQVEDLLPERDEVIRREAGVLTDAGAIDYSGTVAGGMQFVLEYACLGEGELEVEVVPPGGSTHYRRLTCDATLDWLEFSADSTGYGVVQVVAHTTRFVGVAVQLASGEHVENLAPVPTSPSNQQDEEGTNTWPRSY